MSRLIGNCVNPSGGCSSGSSPKLLSQTVGSNRELRIIAALNAGAVVHQPVEEDKGLPSPGASLFKDTIGGSQSTLQMPRTEFAIMEGAMSHALQIVLAYVIIASMINVFSVASQ